MRTDCSIAIHHVSTVKCLHDFHPKMRVDSLLGAGTSWWVVIANGCILRNVFAYRCDPCCASGT